MFSNFVFHFFVIFFLLLHVFVCSIYHLLFFSSHYFVLWISICFVVQLFISCKCSYRILMKFRYLFVFSLNASFIDRITQCKRCTFCKTKIYILMLDSVLIAAIYFIRACLSMAITLFVKLDSNVRSTQIVYRYKNNKRVRAHCTRNPLDFLYLLYFGYKYIN